jgi:hypothetical protein
MPQAPDILARSDAILVLAALAELQAIRAEVATAGTIVPPDNGLVDADDLLDTTSAAARFGFPRDTIAKWCREENLGVRRGGRWLVSIPRLQKRLNGG